MNCFGNRHAADVSATELPNQFAVLESVEGGGVVVRFREPVEVKEKARRAARPKESWRPDESDEGAEISNLIGSASIWRLKPMAIYCDQSQGLIDAIERAKLAYKKIQELDRDGGMLYAY
jgi:hypothetical protein